MKVTTFNRLFPFLFPIFRLFSALIAAVRICHFTSYARFAFFLFLFRYLCWWNVTKTHSAQTTIISAKR
nr:MAG TPA: hypothetical protein [Inoviridae sp.]